MKKQSLWRGLFLGLVISLFLNSPLLAQNPLPFVNQPLVPAAVSPGGVAFLLRVNGTGFVPGAVVRWNGAALATTFETHSRLSAAVPAANIAAPGTASIDVTNPTPGGGTSNVAFLSVASPMAPSNFPGFTGLPPARQISIDAQVITGDFNRDGKLDLAAPDGVQLGNGDGTFQPVDMNLPVIANAQGVAAGDFNGDGNLDLAIAISNPASVAILLGNGDGTFQKPLIAQASPGAPQTVVAADFNGDGKLDLAVSNGLNPSQFGANGGISVLIGNGDGTFQAPVAFDTLTVAVPNTLAVGDFNGDNELDLVYVTTSAGQDQLTYLQGKGDGTFLAPERWSLGCNATDLWTADLNGDGNLDVITSDTSVSVPVANGGAVILLGHGDGTFQPPVEYPPGPSIALGVSDFNSDGSLDVALSIHDKNQFSILLGNGDGTLQNTPILPTTIDPRNFSQTQALALTVGDFNGDGRPDLVFPAGSANQGGGLLYIFLQGVYPVASISPATLNFATRQDIGTMSAPQTVTLTNGGGSPLSINSITASGDFSETNTCGGTLEPLASCTLSVTFAPSAESAFAGMIKISDNAVGSPHSIALAGNGSGPSAQFSPSSLTFGSQAAGTTSTAQTVTLTNNGSVPLAIASIVVSGDFGGTDNCVTASPIAVNGTCIINISFTPQASGTRTGQITVTDNAGGPSSQTVALTGTGLQAVVTVLPVSLTFASQYVGTTTQAQNLTIFNTGNAPLTITGVQASSSSGAGSFTDTNQCTGAIPVGMNCTIAVTFAPTATGTITGTLTLTDNATGSPQLVPLLGTGEDFALQMGQGSITSSGVTAGETATFPLTLTSEGGFRQPVTLTCFGAPADSTCTANPAKVMLDPNGPTSIALNVATMAPSRGAPHWRLGPPTAPRGDLRKLLILAAIWALAALALAGGLTQRARPTARAALALFALVLLMGPALLSCGGGQSAMNPSTNPGTPSGTYPLTVTATFASGGTVITHNLTLTLKVN